MVNHAELKALIGAAFEKRREELRLAAASRSMFDQQDYDGFCDRFDNWDLSFEAVRRAGALDLVLTWGGTPEALRRLVDAAHGYSVSRNVFDVFSLLRLAGVK